MNCLYLTKNETKYVNNLEGMIAPRQLYQFDPFIGSRLVEWETESNYYLRAIN